jgi:hypothetical protein
VLRAGDETFDERKYGFAGLVEALRFGQREGLFRLDRDRQGVLRVYPGQLLQRAEGMGGDAAPIQRELPVDSTPAPVDAGDEPMDTAPQIDEATSAAATAAAEEVDVDVEASAPAARTAKRRSLAKKPVAKKAAEKAAAPKAKAAKAAAPKKRAAKKSGA